MNRYPAFGSLSVMSKCSAVFPARPGIKSKIKDIFFSIDPGHNRANAIPDVFMFFFNCNGVL
jgi:hypothetical protein